MQAKILIVLIVLLSLCSVQVYAETYTQSQSLGNILLYYNFQRTGAYPLYNISTDPSMNVIYSLQPNSRILDGSFNKGYIQICPGIVQVNTSSIDGSGAVTNAGLIHNPAVEQKNMTGGGGSTLNLRFNTTTTYDFTGSGAINCYTWNSWDSSDEPCWKLMNTLQYDNIAVHYYPVFSNPANILYGMGKLSLYCGANVEVKKDTSLEYTGNLEDLGYPVDFLTEGSYNLRIDIGDVTCVYLARSLSTNPSDVFNQFSSERFCLSSYGSTNCDDAAQLYKYDVTPLDFTVGVSDPQSIHVTLIRYFPITTMMNPPNTIATWADVGNDYANFLNVTAVNGSADGGFTYTPTTGFNEPIRPAEDKYLYGDLTAPASFKCPITVNVTIYFNSSLNCENNILHTNVTYPIVVTCSDLPDYQIDVSPTYDVPLNSQVDVNYTTVNRGTVMPANDSTTLSDLYAVQPTTAKPPTTNPTMPSPQTVTPLSPGNGLAGDFTVNCSSYPVNATYEICADFYNNITESLEGNNCNFTTVRCGMSPMPDLEPRLGITPSLNVQVGQTAVIYLNTTNTRTAPTQNFSYMTLMFGPNTVTGYPFKVPYLWPGNNTRGYSYLFNCTAATVGAHTIFGAVDIYNDVTEYNENNNNITETLVCGNATITLTCPDYI